MSRPSSLLGCLSPIVRPLLRQIARQRAAGCLDEKKFQAQLKRLSKEELCVHGVSLLATPLPNGRIRYLLAGGPDHQAYEYLVI